MQLGDTFVWSPEGRTPHLYIVISDPSKNGKFVVVNLTNSNHGAMSFTLQKGDHPFIYKDSDVNFGDAMVVDMARMQTEINLKNAIPNFTMALTIVQRIAIKAMDHPAVSGEIQDVLSAEWQ